MIVLSVNDVNRATLAKGRDIYGKKLDKPLPGFQAFPADMRSEYDIVHG